MHAKNLKNRALLIAQKVGQKSFHILLRSDFQSGLPIVKPTNLAKHAVVS